MTNKEYIERRELFLTWVGANRDVHSRKWTDVIEPELIKQYDQLILDIAFAAMESCEPDCDEVRHAIHQGSWDTMNRIEQIVGADEEN